MVQIRINYETLFDLVRREKNREELQTIDSDFYDQLKAYLGEKEEQLQKKDEALFFSADKEKLKTQFQNIRRLAKELYERREKKIINIALVRARTGSEIIDTSPMLPSEKRFFDEQVRVLSRFREEVLGMVLQAGANHKSPRLEPPKAQTLQEPKQSLGGFEDALERLNREEEDGASELDATKNTKTVRITQSLPRFVGLKGEALGPFEEGVVVELDSQIADLLLKKGRAQTS